MLNDAPLGSASVGLNAVLGEPLAISPAPEPSDMPGKITFGDATGLNYFAIISASDGRVAFGTTLVDWNPANLGSYAIAVAETAAGSRRYMADFPQVESGNYRVEVYRQVGAAPALTDIDAGPAYDGWIQWSGTGEVRAFDPSAKPTFRSQDGVSQPTYEDCLAASWVAVCGAESTPPGTASYVRKMPDGEAFRTFVLAIDAYGNAYERA